jgi:manganese/zinc/iron transport system permease protein
MFSEILHTLSGWATLDTWIVVTAALAAMACALPGNFLLLRRQSMMGDALSHTMLPGIVLAFLLTHWFRAAGWLPVERGEGHYAGTVHHAALFLGAMVLGVFSALLTEWVQKLGRVESSAALGVVFTTLFAVGLILVRVAADTVDLDPDCVLYGTIEFAVLDTLGDTGLPRAAAVNAAVLAANLLMVVLFYKELRISAFDPALASTLGINARRMHYALMAVTAATVVAAFESVGSILVIAVLIVPPATAYLLTDRLSWMIGLSLAIAAASAALGHVLAITVPPVVFGALGFDNVESASTAGMMAAACGLLFVGAMLLGPRYGLASKLLDRMRLGLRIACEDILGTLYRWEEGARPLVVPHFGGMHEPPEHGTTNRSPVATLRQVVGVGPVLSRLAVWRLSWAGQIASRGGEYQLTPSGREAARNLVRSHRLWESYVSKHFAMPDDHLHEPAARVEHFLGPSEREELAAELDRPQRDPHGKEIPAPPGEVE